METLIASPNYVGVPVDLEGVVVWVGPERDQFIVQTPMMALRVKMDVSGQSVLAVGQRVRLTGQGTAGHGVLGEALVDNDGLHSVTEKSGSAYLRAGWQPIRADWFNGLKEHVLEVDYAGPHLSRRPIPDGVLFHADTGRGHGANPKLMPGLAYQAYEGDWQWLPHWASFIPVRAGVIANFDLQVRSREEGVGLQFIGFLRVDQEGVYDFWTRSDDGSRLFVGDTPLRVEVLGSSPLPKPRNLQPGQTLEAGDIIWASMEGMVTAAHTGPGGTLEVELSGDAGRTCLEMGQPGLSQPAIFSHVRARGVCESLTLPGHGLTADRLLVADGSLLEEIAPAPVFTNWIATSLSELRRLSASGQRTGCALRLEGTVVAISPSPELLAFQDDTGGAIVRLPAPQTAVAAGQKVVLSGFGPMDGNVLLLGNGPLVDNDGLHARQEKTAAAFLAAGRHPVHLSWFCRGGPPLLEVYWQGPDFPRQEIPATVLSHPEYGAAQEMNWRSGLNFSGYEGDWQRVPELDRLGPLRAGLAETFTVQPARRSKKTGLEFSGFLEVPRDGQYFFSVISSDGAQLFLDEQTPRIVRGDIAAPPAPRPLLSRRIIDPQQNNRWSEAEGTVTFASERAGSLFLELNCGDGPLNVQLVDGSGASPSLLLGCRVHVVGFCHSADLPSGQGLAASLITLGSAQVGITAIPAASWTRYPLQPVAEVLGAVGMPGDDTVVHVRGERVSQTNDHRLLLTDETGAITVEPIGPVPQENKGPVEMLGRLARDGTNTVLRSAIFRTPAEEVSGAVLQLPLLTTVRQVKQLSREQAQRHYPVKVRGVITLVRGNGSGFIIQDDTSAIDVWWPPDSNTSLPRVGDYWEVAGQTFAEFSPNINSQHAVRLGPGIMPEPLHPEWDQLLNGSLDTEYVEIQGIVTAAEDGAVTLRMRGGKLRVLLSPVSPETLKHCENALIRVRGCVVPIRDQRSEQVQVGQLRLSNVSLNVDEPAPADPFGVDLKHAADLFLFDARAGSLERVKIAGQVLHAGGGEFFLLDGSNAVRVLPPQPVSLQPGDLVEVVGFPELGGPSPVLHEALVRRTGAAALPAPLPVPADSLFSAGHDGQLVSVAARLVDISGNTRERTLELQTGNREFVARLEATNNIHLDLARGSLLELTGVYSEQGDLQSSGQQLASFELLLNSPAAVRVLERPPWWNLRRALLFAGGLAVVILAAVFWIVLLRRRVEERSAELAREVRHREQVQQQNALEKERTRIAKDMHDQLGTNVTQVGLLAELTRKNAHDPGKTTAHAERMCATAVELGRTLDEIVWAVNPRNDSLDKFCDYLAVQAQELFQLTNVLCRVDLPPEMPGHPLSAETRHNLFLATKEALNNVARHAQAREVWIRFELAARRFQITIVDDGRGFVYEPKHSLRNGMQNMRKRLEDSNGHLAVRSEPNQGTRVTLTINLPPAGGA